MNREPENDSWFQRLHRWRERNSNTVYLVLLSLVALLFALRYMQNG